MTALDVIEQSIELVATDPRNENRSFSWEASFSWPSKDIMVCRNALPFLPDLVKAANAWGAWEPCTVVRGDEVFADKNQRDTDHIGITTPDAKGHPEVNVYGVMIHSVETRFLVLYQEQNVFAQITESSGFDLLRYGVGQFFGEHVDVIPGNHQLGRRVLSIIAFCDDDYEGGDLVFPRQEVRLQAEPGMLVLFPSSITHPHKVEPVTKGVRHSVVGWYY